jgi:hypothetical protein
MNNKLLFVSILGLFILTSNLYAAEPYKGFSSEINPGIFFTIGGNKSISNSEPYYNFVLGYSFSKASMAGISLGASMVSNNAPKKKTGDLESDKINYDNFTLVFANISYLHKLDIANDLFIPIKVFGGGAIPSPSPNNSGSFLPDFGAATGIGYDSYRKGLNLGVEIAFSYILKINAKAAMIYPTIKYVF